MTTSPLSPDEFRAAAEVHRELGPEYSDAVLESFLEKVDREIGARIDARLASAPRARRRPAETSSLHQRRALLTGLSVGAAITGIPLTGIVVILSGSASVRADWQLWLFGTWLGIALLCVLAASVRKPRGRE